MWQELKLFLVDDCVGTVETISPAAWKNGFSIDRLEYVSSKRMLENFKLKILSRKCQKKAVHDYDSK